MTLYLDMPTAIKTHNRTVYETHTMDILEHQAQGIREIASLSPIEDLLYKTTLPHLGKITNVPSTQKKHRKAVKMERHMEHIPNERTSEIAEK